LNTYTIDVLTFKDGNNDGIGDIKGILEKQNYICNLPVDAIILRFFNEIDEYQYIIENKEDVKKLKNCLHKHNKLLFLYFHINSIPIDHNYFKEAKSGNKYFQQFFILSDKPPHTLETFNNYNAWGYSPEMRKYYLSLIKGRIDLNFYNSQVQIFIRDELKELSSLFDGFVFPYPELLLKNFIPNKTNHLHELLDMETPVLFNELMKEIKSYTKRNLFIISEPVIHNIWKMMDLVDFVIENRLIMSKNITDLYNLLLDYKYILFNGMYIAKYIMNNSFEANEFVRGIDWIEFLGMHPIFSQMVINILTVLGPWHYNIYSGTEIPILSETKGIFPWTNDKYVGFSTIEPRYGALPYNFKKYNIENNPTTLQIMKKIMQIRKKMGRIRKIKSELIDEGGVFYYSEHEKGSVMLFVNLSAETLNLSVYNEEQKIIIYLFKDEIIFFE